MLVFVALVQHLLDLGSFICLLSVAVQALKLGKLAFIVVVGAGREGRGAAGKGEKANAAGGLLNGTLYLPCTDEQDVGTCWS